MILCAGYKEIKASYYIYEIIINTSSIHQQSRFMSFKHKYYEDEEDPLFVIKPTMYLEILVQG
jgi:hypothetical protein